MLCRRSKTANTEFINRGLYPRGASRNFQRYALDKWLKTPNKIDSKTKRKSAFFIFSKIISRSSVEVSIYVKYIKKRPTLKGITI